MRGHTPETATFWVREGLGPEDAEQRSLRHKRKMLAVLFRGHSWIVAA